jgi:hypothetical protein
VLKLWEDLGDRALSWTKIWGAKPVGLQVYQILSDGEFEDPKMIGNRSAAIIAVARRGGDRMLGDVYSWQILCKSLFASPIANFRTLRAAI